MDDLSFVFRLSFVTSGDPAGNEDVDEILVLTGGRGGIMIENMSGSKSNMSKLCLDLRDQGNAQTIGYLYVRYYGKRK